jgi:hypothetical protein
MTNYEAVLLGASALFRPLEFALNILLSTDIEGTTTPISFVKDVLFPFAVAKLDAFVDSEDRDPEKREKLNDHIEAFRQVRWGKLTFFSTGLL